MTQPYDQQQQPDAPRPPGWGQPTPVYGPPQDPFQTTTMTPVTAFGGGQPPPKKRNKGLIIVSIVLGVMLVLCAVGGVGAFLLLRNTEGQGAASPREAAQEFLTAIYKDHDATEAEKLVCGEARDREAITAKVNEVKDQKAKHQSPSITWDTPKIANETAEQADTTVTVKLTTADEKVSEQTIKLTLVKREGWFVCEVEVQKQ